MRSDDEPHHHPDRGRPVLPRGHRCLAHAAASGNGRRDRRRHARRVADLLQVAVTVAHTRSGFSALRMARERPKAPIIGMTPRLATARRLALVWGVHAVLTHKIADVLEMTEFAGQAALRKLRPDRSDHRHFRRDAVRHPRHDQPAADRADRPRSVPS